MITQLIQEEHFSVNPTLDGTVTVYFKGDNQASLIHVDIYFDLWFYFADQHTVILITNVHVY